MLPEDIFFATFMPDWTNPNVYCGSYSTLTRIFRACFQNKSSAVSVSVESGMQAVEDEVNRLFVYNS